MRFLVAACLACPVFFLPSASACASGRTPAPSAKSPIVLSKSEAASIGKKIWKNECGGTVSGLTTWNKGEYFASLGIGHFIWYPKGVSGPFEESFPPLIAFMKSRKVMMPRWVAETRDCPWRTKAQFDAAKSSAQMVELRKFLHATIPHQTEFIFYRLQRALPKMLNSVPARERATIEARFRGVASSSLGVYALMDYVNFKGEGTNPKERYKGQGWGMLQVLQEMNGTPTGTAAAREFGESAERVLRRRVRNAPKDESRWMAGWRNRTLTYRP